MAQVEPHAEEIKRAGAQLVYIAAEKRQGWFKPEAFLRAHPVSFPFLLDEDRAVTKAYGLYHRFAHDAFRIAHPATLVVDREGKLRYIYRGENQTDRAPLHEMMRALAQTI
jgi:peroxiredoxin